MPHCCGSCLPFYCLCSCQPLHACSSACCLCHAPLRPWQQPHSLLACVSGASYAAWIASGTAGKHPAAVRYQQLLSEAAAGPATACTTAAESAAVCRMALAPALPCSRQAACRIQQLSLAVNSSSMLQPAAAVRCATRHQAPCLLNCCCC
jgi:hypothetical protein